MIDMGWLRSVGPLKSYVSFAKERYKRDYILQKRPIFLRSLRITATPYDIIDTHLFRVYSQCVSVWVFKCVGACLWVGVGVCKYTHTHTHTHTHIFSSLFLYIFLSASLFLSHSVSLPLALSRVLSVSLAHTHQHSHQHTHTHAQTDAPLLREHVAVWCSVLQCFAVCCSML